MAGSMAVKTHLLVPTSGHSIIVGNLISVSFKVQLSFFGIRQSNFSSWKDSAKKRAFLFLPLTLVMLGMR